MTESALTIAFIVLHTSPLDTPGTKDAGGMNVVVRAHAEHLAARGHRVQLITRRSDPQQPDSIELAPGLTAHHLDAGPARLLAKGEHENLVGDFGRALATHLRDHPADIIHAQHWYSGVAALPVARELDIPLVQSYHSIAAAEDTPLAEGERPEAPGRLEAEARLARDADLVIAVSEAERSTVIERLGGSPDRIRIVNPGVDTELFHPLRESAGSAPAVDVEAAADAAAVEAAADVATAAVDAEADVATAADRSRRPEVLVAGRLHPLKGFDLAIAAVAEIPVDHRPNLRIIGSPPPDGDDYAESLQNAVRASGLESAVVFDGALDREALAARLRETTIVLIPSHSETFGLVALEAAASGVPVIARAAGGLREAVIDGETGVLIDSGDSAGESETANWARAMRQLLDDPEAVQRMGCAGRESALQRNWEASTLNLEEAYRGLLAGRSASDSERKL